MIDVLENHLLGLRVLDLVLLDDIVLADGFHGE